MAAAERIARPRQGHGVDLQVSFMHRFFDEVVGARRWIDEGLSGTCSLPHPQCDTRTGLERLVLSQGEVANGVVDQLGVHGIDLVEQLLGPVRKVSGRARIARLSDAFATGRSSRSSASTTRARPTSSTTARW